MTNSNNIHDKMKELELTLDKRNILLEFLLCIGYGQEQFNYMIANNLYSLHLLNSHISMNLKNASCMDIINMTHIKNNISLLVNEYHDLDALTINNIRNCYFLFENIISEIDDKLIYECTLRHMNSSDTNSSKNRLSNKKKPEINTLYITNKKIKTIHISSIKYNLNNLKYLFLPSNKIQSLSFNISLPYLSCLDMTDNLIKTIENIENFPFLESLILKQNLILKVENIEKCNLLKILNLNNQKYVSSQCLEFDSNSVNYLPIEEIYLDGNSINDDCLLKLKNSLSQLKKVCLTFNNIQNPDTLIQFLANKENLENVSYIGNPLCDSNSNIRNTLINQNKSLTIINSKEILYNERVYIENLYKNKHFSYENNKKDIEKLNNQSWSNKLNDFQVQVPIGFSHKMKNEMKKRKSSKKIDYSKGLSKDNIFPLIINNAYCNKENKEINVKDTSIGLALGNSYKMKYKTYQPMSNEIGKGNN